MARKKPSLQHLDWLVKHRSVNQTSAFDLYKLTKEHSDKINRIKSNRMLVQLLVSVNFSLWRAVFTSDIEVDRTSMLKHAEDFLERLIESNMIAFSQDAEFNSYSYRYYLLKARDRLERLEGEHYRLIPIGTLKPMAELTGKPKLWWEDNQSALNLAIKQLGNRLRGDEANSN